MSSHAGYGGQPAPRRLWTFAVCGGLTALALKQAPSLQAGDTKLDLAVDPLHLLGRALHLWDPTTEFGVTQNQGYGYLFPLGPFFVLGKLAGLPPWVVQRLWWAVLLCVAFLGIVRLAERLQLGNPTTRLVAGVAFALSPRVLSTLGPISVESLPYCLAPWVLCPLVVGARGGSPRRAAARSAAAVLFMGAVNATAVLAALPPAVLFLLTREPGPRRRRLMAWWAGCVLLATSWWLLPLLLLGKYSPPFLDYIESAATTTSVTSLVEVLRGTSDWVGYVASVHGPTWPAAFALLTSRAAVLYTVLVAAFGFAGLTRKDLPERTWLLLCVLLGVLAVSFGHGASGLAGWERQLLDGPLAPFRNVHKFDVVLRLPLVLALAHVLERWSIGAPGLAARTARLRRNSVAVGAVAAIVGAVTPALAVGLAPRHPFTDIPGYWSQTATWLAQRHAQGAALLLPGSSFPDYLWGSSNDEPLQPLARSAWAVRNAVPLTPPGTVRVLDAIEKRLATGEGSPGLAEDLKRAGVHFLVLRNDLDYGAAGSTRPLLVHRALAGSPGIERVKVFGPVVGGGILGRRADDGLEIPYPTVEIYQVQRHTAAVELSALSDAARLAGGPESLLALDDRGLLGGRPVVLAQDAAAIPGWNGPVLLSDGLRRREVFYGRLADSTSATLGANDRFRLSAPAHDYLPTNVGQLAVSDLVGARSIEVSSSASDANAYGGAQPWHVPYAALDGDPATSWRSDPAVSSEHARWTLHLSENRSVKGLQVRFDSVGGRRPTQVKISGQGGAALVDVPTDDRAVSVSLAGTTNWLRIETAAAKGSGPGALGLAEVTLPGLSVRRTLRTVPTPRGAATSAVVLDVADGARDACYELLLNWLCSEDVARPGEEDEGIDRTLALGKTSTFSLSAQVRAVPGKALDDLLQRGNPVAVTASSSAVGDPEGRPPVVLDGDLGTGWRAAPGDKDPSLHVAWSTPQRLSGLRLLIDPSLAVSRARSVEVVSVDGTRSGKVDALGLVTFPDLTTRAITVHLRRPAVAVTVNPYTTQSALLPVGLSELDVIGLSLRGSGPTRFVLPCGRAPDITIDRQVVHTAVTITRPQLLGLARVPLRICSSEAVTAGPGSRVVSRASQLLRPVALTMTGSIATAAPTMPVTTRRWQATLRQVGVPARDEPMLLRVHENTNPGWVASLAGKSLRPVVLDGWQQGWLVPAGPAGTVSLTYAPDVLYRRALLFGALAALFLLALALRGGAGASEASGPRAAGAVSIVVGLGAVLLVGGLTAAGACLLVLLLGLLLRRRSGWQSVAAPGLLGAAGLLLARQPWTSSHYAGHGYAAQALCVTALAVTWSALPVGGRSGTSRRKRMAGRSSTR